MYWFDLEPAEGLADRWAADAVDRAFDGPSWLRPRFPAGRAVILRLRSTLAADVTVTAVASIGGSRKRLTADVHLPAHRRRSRFGLLHAAVVGLTAIGTEFALGPCPLRRPDRPVRAPLIPLPSRPPVTVPPGRLLLVAGDPVDGAWHDEVAARLSAVRTSETTWIR
ncbi:hypothetical protein ACQP00_05995 [Dactylosporangium sp. CS-047395]|uniref:hypothetical protein n=1 Tax=Dactylosporangium sp. CS-047395 TaxID=3239936 RepID=UPI003D94DEC1